ncbi:MAG: LptF/LptG family permease [Pseudomonadota bacterium]
MTLSLYLSKVIGLRVLAAGLVFLILGISIDLIQSATDLLAEAGPTAILGYAALRTPQIAATLFPVAVLVGGTVAFLTLGHRSELVIVRAAGRSIFAILRMLAPCALVLGLIYHLMGDQLSAWAEQRLSETFPKTTEAPEAGASVWSRQSGQVMRAELATSDGTALRVFTLWELDAQGHVTGRRDAERAEFDDGVWVLRDVTRHQGDQRVQELESSIWHTALTPSAMRALAAGRLSVSTANARAALAGLAVQTRGEAYYASRIARSYAALVIPGVMLVLAALAGFGLARSGGGLRMAITGVVLGFLYIAMDGVLGALSEVGMINAVIAATVPTALFAALGIWGLLVLEE